MTTILRPVALTRRGETMHEDTAPQASRIEASIWQALAERRRSQQAVNAQLTTATWAGDHVATPRFAQRHHGWVSWFDEAFATASEDLGTVESSYKNLLRQLSDPRCRAAMQRASSALAASETSSQAGALQQWLQVGAKPHTSSRQWTREKNRRRCELVDKEIDGKLTPEEGAELGALQKEMLDYRRAVAPLPLAEVRELHQELLNRAGGT